MRGTVTDGRDDRALSAALVLLLDANEEVNGAARTNARGAFTIKAPEPGTYKVRVQRFGYATLESALVEVTDSLRLEVRLRQVAVVLDSVVVTGTGRQNSNRSGFLRRQKAGFGRYLGPAEIARRRPSRASDLVWGTPGFVVDNGLGGTTLRVRSRGRNCTPTLYLDGTRIPPFEGRLDLDSYVSASQVRAVEFYQDATWAPGEFQSMTNGCAVIAVWTDFGFGEF